MASDNKSLGRFILDGIPPAPRGVPQIEVTFDIDANGILKVTAQDKATSRSQHITITASSGLTEAEIDQMKADAERFADEDRKRKDLVEARNNADNMAYSAEKAMEELGDKVPEDIKNEVNEKVAEVRKVLEDQNSDANTLNRVTDELSNVVQKIGAAAYQQAGPPPTGAPEGYTTPPEGQSSPSDDEDVVDGEFKDA
jgi:molecular chaperone DnaK